jgi:hypothetical protein
MAYARTQARNAGVIIAAGVVVAIVGLFLAK